MKRVIVESPYTGNNEENVGYARECIRDSLTHGESPIASHLLYTQPGILDDNNPCERAIGIAAGLCWSRSADYVVVYTDRGITHGMSIGIQEHLRNGKQVIYRSLNNQKSTHTA